MALRAARLWNSVSDVRRPLVLAGTIFLQVLALAMSMFMALQYFLRYAHRRPVPNCSHAFSNTWSMTVLSESHFRTIASVIVSSSVQPIAAVSEIPQDPAPIA